jgi:hypothetical protein
MHPLLLQIFKKIIKRNVRVKESHRPSIKVASKARANRVALPEAQDLSNLLLNSADLSQQQECKKLNPQRKKFRIRSEPHLPS